MNAKKQRLFRAFESRPLVLAGALRTELQARGPPDGGPVIEGKYRVIDDDK